MDEFAVLTEAIRRVFPSSRLEPATEERIARLRREYPNVPSDYLEFLRRVGWGTLGNSNFMVYSGPCTPDSFFDVGTAVELADVLFVGDNFSGWIVGFDTRRGWQLVGVDSSSPEPEPLEQGTLGELIAQRVADRERPV